MSQKPVAPKVAAEKAVKDIRRATRKIEHAIAAFVENYDHHHYHESLSNLTPADVYLGRGDGILADRALIKSQTLRTRRLLHKEHAA